MGDRYDVHLRKTEMAWELAQTALELDQDRDKDATGYMAPATYLEKAAEHLCTAWTLVDKQLPTKPKD